MRRRLFISGSAFSWLAAVPLRGHAQTDSEIAPGGRLRVALLVANPVLAQAGPDGSPRGMASDLGRFIASKLRARFEPVAYQAVTSFTASYGKDEWDILIGPHTTAGEEKAVFSPDVMLVDNLYLAAPGKDFADATQVDRPGVKIAVAERGAPDQFLSRTLSHATLLRLRGDTEEIAGALRSGAADLYASNGENTFQVGQILPGSRILPGAVTTVRMAVAMPKNRSAAAQALLAHLVADAKAEGVIAKAIAAQNLKGVRAAP